MSARVEHQPAYILHRRPYRETSWLLDVFTPDFGKLSLVAKGARKSKSQDAALYQPFLPLSISWLGKSTLKTLTSIELRSLPLSPAGRLGEMAGERLFVGFYLNELLERLLADQDPAPNLFMVYESTMTDLRAGVALEPTLRLFEKLMLEELGVGVSFELDAASGEEIDPAALYLFLPQAGFVQVDEAARVAYDVRSAPLLVPGEALLAIAGNDFGGAESLRFAKRIMRRCIDDLLGGRELRSRELIRQYKETQRA